MYVLKRMYTWVQEGEQSMAVPAPEWLDADKFRSDYQQRRSEYVRLKAECDAREEELREMEGLAAKWDLQLDGPETEADSLSHMTVREAAEVVLREAGRPLSTDELFDALTARGVTIRGDAPKNTLYGTLYNDKKRLVKIGSGRGRLWGLRGRDAADAEVEAEQAEQYLPELHVDGECGGVLR